LTARARRLVAKAIRPIKLPAVAAPANGWCVFIWAKKILNPMYNYKRIDSSLAGEQKDSTTITKSSMSFGMSTTNTTFMFLQSRFHVPVPKSIIYK
jgi:hypothetical protein